MTPFKSCFRHKTERKLFILICFAIYIAIAIRALQYSEVFLHHKKNYDNKNEITISQKGYIMPKKRPLILSKIIHHPQNMTKISLPVSSRETTPIRHIDNSDLGSNYIYFTEKFPLLEEPLKSWTAPEFTSHYCNGRLTTFGDRFAIARRVTMHPLRRSDYQKQAKGGEEVRFVLNQQLWQEEYRFQNNFWEIPCSQTLNTQAISNFYWMKNIQFVSETADKNATIGNKSETSVISGAKVTIGVRRGDYANLHNWVRCIYNTFLVMMQFNLQPSQVSILFLDGHPFTYLDKAWEIIYDKPIRVGQLTDPIHYENFVWGFQENQGPITEPSQQNTVPYLEEFRSFALSRFNLTSQHKLYCNKLRITFILRRNAVYHPRNVEGKVGRKIFNEAEIVAALMAKFPTAHVRTILMESVPMASQLKISSTTDIWIGMHGAGMSHIIFLPKHAGVLELFAKGFKTGRPWFKCFHEITNWRNMSYETWENMDSALEMPNDFTIVPPEIVTSKVDNLIQKICPK